MKHTPTGTIMAVKVGVSDVYQSQGSDPKFLGLIDFRNLVCSFLDFAHSWFQESDLIHLQNHLSLNLFIPVPWNLRVGRSVAWPPSHGSDIFPLGGVPRGLMFSGPQGF